MVLTKYFFKFYFIFNLNLVLNLLNRCFHVKYISKNLLKKSNTKKAAAVSLKFIVNTCLISELGFVLKIYL